MHADGDERGERRSRTANGALMLRAEGAQARLFFRRSAFEAVLHRRFCGGSGILRRFRVFKAQKLVNGNAVELAQFNKLLQLRLRRAGIT